MRAGLVLRAEVLDAMVCEITQRVLDELEKRGEGNAWPDWLSIESAARYLDVSPERIRKLVARREIPFHQEGPGCRIFFRRRELDEWMGQFRQGVLRTRPGIGL